MNYAAYAKALSHKYIRNYEESKRILKTLFESISQDLTQGKRVYFRGFGSFKKVLRPPRKYRNIATGKIETRPATQDINFTPSKKLLEALKFKELINYSLKKHDATYRGLAKYPGKKSNKKNSHRP